ncbi:MAG: hypothetical protein RKO66_12770 [Candidatus Contendobacter sp.]|nr:hypothetical protein [Candidatus Contendobacter sp.]
MIGLLATAYDPSGAVILPARAMNAWSGSRRGSITQTLDGSVSIYDGGYSIGDQTMTVRVTHPTKTLLTALRYLVGYYGQLVATCETGCYRVVPAYTVDGDTLTVTLRIVSRLDA